MDRRANFESGAAREGRTHVFHEIGRTECVDEGCEPMMPHWESDSPDEPPHLVHPLSADEHRQKAPGDEEIAAWNDIISQAKANIKNRNIKGR